MKKYSIVIMAVSLCLNLILGTFISYNILQNTPVTSIISNITTAGVYGPVGMDTIIGDAVISAADVVMQNTIITGNLYIKEEVGEGSVTLKNVVVKGEVIISGGGESGIILEDVSINQMTVDKKGIKVRVSASGKTAIATTTLNGTAILVEEELSFQSAGFQFVLVNSKEEIALQGNFDILQINRERAKVAVFQGAIGTVTIAANAGSSSIRLGKNSEVGLLEINANADIEGEGTVKEILVKTAGLTRLAGFLGQVTAQGDYISLEIAAGGLQELIVLENTPGIAIHLHKNLIANYVELNSRAIITGAGIIKLLAINAPGTIVETVLSPKKVILAKGITAIVAGKELPEKVTPKPAQRPVAAKPHALKPSEPPPPAPEDVKSFVVRAGLSIGKKMVVVTLHATNPGIYTVTVGGARLSYLASERIFYGEVNESAAHIRNVRVTR